MNASFAAALCICLLGASSACTTLQLMQVIYPCTVRFTPNLPLLSIALAPNLSLDGLVITLCSQLDGETMSNLLDCFAPNLAVLACEDNPLFTTLNLINSDNVQDVCEVAEDAYNCINGTTALIDAYTCTQDFFNHTEVSSAAQKCRYGEILRSCIYESTESCKGLLELEMFRSMTEPALSNTSNSCQLSDITTAPPTTLPVWLRSTTRSTSPPAAHHNKQQTKSALSWWEVLLIVLGVLLLVLVASAAVYKLRTRSRMRKDGHSNAAFSQPVSDPNNNHVYGNPIIDDGDIKLIEDSKQQKQVLQQEQPIQTELAISQEQTISSYQWMREERVVPPETPEAQTTQHTSFQEPASHGDLNRECGDSQSSTHF